MFLKLIYYIRKVHAGLFDKIFYVPVILPLMFHCIVTIICFRSEKEKQTLIIEIDNVSTQLDASNKARVRLGLV